VAGDAIVLNPTDSADADETFLIHWSLCGAHPSPARLVVMMVQTLTLVVVSRLLEPATV